MASPIAPPSVLDGSAISTGAHARRRATWARVRRGLGILAATAVTCTAGYLLFVAPVPARSLVADRGPVIERVHGRGTIESERESELGFDLVGRLSSVEVDEGDHVTLGQALARLELDQLAAELEAAASGVDAARASLRRLGTEERAARDAVASAEREERRVRELSDHGAAPTAELDAAADHARAARTALDRVLAQRTEATRGIEVARGGAAARETTVGRATLLSPFDGLVVRRLREPGDTVGVGSTVLRLVDPERLVARALVDEAALPSLAEGQPVEVRFPGDPETYLARLDRIGSEADRQTHELPVDVVLERPFSRRVAIGQRVDVWIEVDRRPDAVRVPSEAIRREGLRTYVWLDREGRVAVADVEVGLVGEERVEVVAGLSEGDVVLLPPEPRGVLAVGRRWRAP